ncbi:MAG: hypothetical protein ABEJ68_10365 [Halobacteriaceae archaeon]
MEDAERARAAAREAVDEISPPELRRVIDDRLAECSVIPGVLTLVSARIGDATADAAAVERRAAGVQLIYEGLRLTRTLVREDPWTPDPPPDIPADVDVVAADVMVARGFRLLARTAAAEKAVETVRAFGRDETDRRAGRGATPAELEANVFDLAAVAGASATLEETPRSLRQYVVGLAHSHGDGPLGPVADVLPEDVEGVMRRVSEDPDAGAGAGEESPRPRSAGSVNRND